jgi:hypothetical protein
MGALYYNNQKDWNCSDIAREIMIKCRQIRMMNPVEYKTNGNKILDEIEQLILRYRVLNNG